MSLSPDALPELAAPGAGGLVRLPAAGDVSFTPRVKALADTPALQRLRHVSQLGVASRVYPGATHTRFEHTLGVFGNACRCLRRLAGVPAFAAAATPDDAKVFLCAALLHDAGHWPFCHPMEDLKLPGVPDHESLAAAEFAPGTPAGAVLERDWQVEPAAVAAFLQGTPLTGDGARDSPARRLLRGLLDGPIDVDKMDYLERDSLHAGVPYGRNFDKDRLIASLTVHPDFGTGPGTLALTAKGRTAAELMVFARYVMFAEVYWHHTVRAATAMLLRAVYDVRANFITPDLFRTTDPEFVARLLAACAGTPAARLADGLFRPTVGVRASISGWRSSARTTPPARSAGSRAGVMKNSPPSRPRSRPGWGGPASARRTCCSTPPRRTAKSSSRSTCWTPPASPGRWRRSPP